MPLPLLLRKACGTSFSIQGNQGSGFPETAMMHDTPVKFANFSKPFCLSSGCIAAAFLIGVYIAEQFKHR